MRNSRGNLFYSDGFKHDRANADFIGYSAEDNQKNLNIIGIPASAKGAEQRFKEDFVLLLKNGNHSAALNMKSQYDKDLAKSLMRYGSRNPKLNGEKALSAWMNMNLLSYEKWIENAEKNKTNTNDIPHLDVTEKGTGDNMTDAQSKLNSDGFDTPTPSPFMLDGIVKRVTDYVMDNKITVALGATVVILGAILLIRSKN